MRKPKPPALNKEQVRRARITAAETSSTTTPQDAEEEGAKPAQEQQATAPPVARNLLPAERNQVINLLGNGYFWAALAGLAALVIPAAIYFGRLDNRVDTISDGLGRLGEKVESIRESLGGQKAQLGTLEHRMGATELSLEAMRGKSQAPTPPSKPAPKQ